MKRGEAKWSEATARGAMNLLRIQNNQTHRYASWPSSHFAHHSCKAGANNCQTGSLRPSAPMKKADMAAAVEKVLASYPQSGIDTIDLGGNKFVDNDLANAGYAKMEVRGGVERSDS